MYNIEVESEGRHGLYKVNGKPAVFKHWSTATTMRTALMNVNWNSNRRYRAKYKIVKARFEECAV